MMQMRAITRPLPPRSRGHQERELHGDHRRRERCREPETTRGAAPGAHENGTEEERHREARVQHRRARYVARVETMSFAALMPKAVTGAGWTDARADGSGDDSLSPMSLATVAWATPRPWLASRYAYAAARMRTRVWVVVASSTTRVANGAGSDSMNASRPDSIARPHEPSGVVTTGIPCRNASSSLMLMPKGPKSGAIIAAERA